MADVSSIRLPSGATYTIKDQTARNGLENKADKTDTVLETTLSRGRASGTTVGTASFAFGNDVIASGNYSQAEGSYTVAEGNSSHAEGMMSKALGAYSHAEGGSSRAIGVNAHSEGSSTTASGDASHTEGRATYTAEKYAHAEGDCLAATAQAAHAEGSGCPDSSTASYINISGSANATTYTFTYPSTSHLTVQAGHIIGMGGTKFANVVSVSGSSVTLSETLSNYRLTNAMAQIYVPSATGYASHAEGVGAKATAVAAHAEGKGTTASYDSAHAEGQGTTASNGAAHAEGWGAAASGYASHAEGMGSSALNASCHAEGSYTKADTYSSHAEGGNTYAQNAYSHAEGQYTIATGMGSHAEGTASGTYTIKLTGSANATTYTYTMSSGESALKPGAYIAYEQAMRMVTGVGSGSVTVAGTLSSTALSNASATLYGHVASGTGSHAEGRDTIVSGAFAHAEGQGTSASGSNSHAEGQGTIASEANCHAEGQYNIAPVSGCIHIVGNGTADNARSNAHTLDMQGNAWYAGDVSVGTDNDYLLREKNLADRYDATSTYAVGDYCIYGGQLYKCTTAISTAEAWDSTHWTATDILSEGGGQGPSGIVDIVYPVGSIYMSASSTAPSVLFPGTYWRRLKDHMLMAAGDTYSAGATGGAANVSYTPAGTVDGHTLTTDEIPSHTHTFTGSSVTSGTESRGHTHSVGAHAHGLNSHVHSVGAHAHGLNSHTHTIAHTHDVYCSAATNNPLSIKAGSAKQSVETREMKVSTTEVTVQTVGTTTSGIAKLQTGASSAANSGAATGSTANSTAFNSGAASGNTANSTAFDSGDVSATHTHNVTAAGSNSSTGGDGAHDHGFTGTAATIDTLPPYLAVYMWMRVATANEAV